MNLCALDVRIASRISFCARMHAHKCVFGLCKCVLATAALHGCLRVYIHGDSWLEPCRADAIVMTSASRAHPDAIGSRVTWSGTWLLS